MKTRIFYIIMCLEIICFITLCKVVINKQNILDDNCTYSVFETYGVCIDTISVKTVEDTVLNKQIEVYDLEIHFQTKNWDGKINKIL